MNASETKNYCLSLKGVTCEVQGDPFNVLCYLVGNKKFAYFKTNDPEKWRLSLRVTPDRFLELTDQSGIKPMRYMSRFHWVTIVIVEKIPDDYLIELINWSYNKAKSSLTKKLQKQIDQ